MTQRTLAEVDAQLRREGWTVTYPSNAVLIHPDALVDVWPDRLSSRGQRNIGWLEPHNAITATALPPRTTYHGSVDIPDGYNGSRITVHLCQQPDSVVLAVWTGGAFTYADSLAAARLRSRGYCA